MDTVTAKKQRLGSEIIQRLHRLDRYLDAADLFRQVPDERAAMARSYLRERSDRLAEEIESLLDRFDKLPSEAEAAPARGSSAIRSGRRNNP